MLTDIEIQRLKSACLKLGKTGVQEEEAYAAVGPRGTLLVELWRMKRRSRRFGELQRNWAYRARNKNLGLHAGAL